MVTSVMMFDGGYDRGIRCRYISEWLKVDYYVSSKDKLLAEIERYMPDVVVIGLDLYERVDGIETSKKIRTQVGVPVVYV